MTIRITIEIEEPLATRLQRLACATNTPLGKLVDAALWQKYTIPFVRSSCNEESAKDKNQ